MFCPRRSAPLAGNRNTPSSEPCGMVGSVTPSSVVFGPLGTLERNQISQKAAPFPATTLEPSFCNVPAIAAGRPDGGGPADSSLYCGNAIPAVMIRNKNGRSIATHHYIGAPDRYMQTILVIDDDESLRDTIGVMLEQEGFRAELVGDGRSGYDRALLLKPDLLLVDLRLPGMSGVEICRQLRAARVKTPIIVLSAVGDEVDKVLLLEIGADDYVVKPFGSRELLARIRALLRPTLPDARQVIHFADTEVDLERRVVTRRGEELKFTPAENNLLTSFLQNPDRPLTRDMILNSVWGYESFPNTRTVDAHVVRLRQKLEPDPNVPRHFLTVHGVGYRFMP